MAEKTEQPTEKRIREARKKGQVAKSHDLTQGVVILAATAMLSFAGGLYVKELRGTMRTFFDPSVLRGDLESERILKLLAYGGGELLLLSLPFLVALMAVAVAIGLVQTRPLFAAEAIKPKLEKLNPAEGFRRVFLSSRTYLELAKMLLKFAVTGIVIYVAVRRSFGLIVAGASQPLSQSAQLASSLMLDFLWKISLLFVVLGCGDFFLQRRLHLKDLMMTKEEVKREFREQEGEPIVRSARRQIHEEILSGSLAEAVPRATLVVTAFELAVALQYDESSMGAPQVTAKGREDTARRIRDLASQYHVPVVPNPSLARSLFEVGLGSEIPESLYGEVAALLNRLYKQGRS